MITKFRLMFIIVCLGYFLRAQTTDHLYLCYAYDTESTTFGYIDTKGKFAIKPQYLLAFNFSDDRAFVQFKDSTWGLINYKGEKVYSLPDTLGSHILSYLINHTGNPEKQNYLSSQLWPFVYEFFCSIELRDSVLVLRNEWFESFYKSRVNNPSSNQPFCAKYYFHLRKGILKNEQDVPVCGDLINKFSEGLAIIHAPQNQIKVINNKGGTIFTVPDSLSKGGYFIKQVFCNGYVTLYSQPSYTYTNANGKKTDGFFHDKLKYVSKIYSDGKITVKSDTNELKQLYHDLQYPHITSKSSKEKGIEYLNEQMHYTLNGCFNEPKDYCNCDPFPNGYLFAYQSNIMVYPKSYRYSEEEDVKAHKDLIGFWDKNQRVRIKPKYKYNTVGTEFRKVYIK